MLVIKGQRNVRIKTHANHQHSCPSCNAYDLQVRIYRNYFHIFFIPFAAFGIKTSNIRCNNCSQPVRIDSLQKHYEDSTKTPFYLYGGLIIVIGFILFLVNVHFQAERREANYIADPQIGDVYAIEKKGKDTTGYYFLRVSRIKQDTLFVYPNQFEYADYTSKLNENDSFIKEGEFYYTKAAIKSMKANGEIISIVREYDGTEGFERIK